MKPNITSHSPLSALRSLGVAVLLAGAFSSTASAEVLLEYRSGTAATLAPYDSVDNVMPSSMVATGGPTRDTANYFQFANWETAHNPGAFVGFTIKADAGHAITLTDFRFDSHSVNHSATLGDLGGVDSFQWGYRVDDNNDGIFEQDWTFGQLYVQRGTGFASNISKTWDFADFSTVGTVQFGIFAAGDPTNWTRVVSNVATLNGSVTAVPEPSTIALFVVASLFAVALVRRKRCVVNA